MLQGGIRTLLVKLSRIVQPTRMRGLGQTRLLSNTPVLTSHGYLQGGQTKLGTEVLYPFAIDVHLSVHLLPGYRTNADAAVIWNAAIFISSQNLFQGTFLRDFFNLYTLCYIGLSVYHL